MNFSRINFFTALVFAVVVTALPAAGGVGGIVGGTAGSSSSVIRGPWIPPNAVFWDTFEDGDATGAQVIRRWQSHTNSSDRQPWYCDYYTGFTDARGDVTNQIAIRNGMWVFRDDIQTVTNAIYLTVSNTSVKPFTMIGGVVDYTNGPGAGGWQLQPGMILGNVANQIPGGDFVHMYQDGANAILQRALAENLIFDSLQGLVAPERQKIFWMFQVDSNSMSVQINNQVFTCTHSNAFLWAATNKVAHWELNGAGGQMYQTTFRWDAVFAGYADQAAAFAGPWGTNRVKLQNVNFRPSLTTNTHILSYRDDVVAVPQTASSTTLVTNKLPPIGTVSGKIFYIYDSIGTAAGSNIWIMVNDGTGLTTFNRGPNQTNISQNYGAITLLGTPTGYEILSRFP